MARKRTFTIFMVTAVLTAPLFSGDFSNAGHTEAAVSVTPDAVEGNISAYFDQKFGYDDGVFVIRHNLSYNPDSSQTVSGGSSQYLNYTLYQAYFDISVKKDVSLTAGKFRIPWTRSIFFAPLDKLNPGLDGLDTKSPREGFLGASLGWSVNQDIHVGACIDATDALTDPQSFASPTFGIYGSWFTGNLDIFFSTLYQSETKGISGIAASAQFFDTIFYGEAGIEWEQHYRYPSLSGFTTDSETEYLLDGMPLVASAGIEKILYLTNSTLSFIAEYQYTECGYKGDELKQALGLLLYGSDPAGPLPSFGRHHAFASAGIELTDLLSLDNSVLCNLKDMSILEMHSFTFFLFTDIDLKAAVQFYRGNKETEFGQSPADYEIDFSAVFHF